MVTEKETTMFDEIAREYEKTAGELKAIGDRL